MSMKDTILKASFHSQNSNMTRSSFFLLLLLSVTFLFSCNKKEELSNPTQFREHLLAYTRGTIAANEELRFIFKEDLFLNQALNEDFLKIEPFLPGRISHPRPNELVFQPEESWQNGSQYKIELKLSEAFPEQFAADLIYKIKILKQYLRVELAGVLINNDGNQRYLLDVSTADEVAPGELKSCFETDATDLTVIRSGEKSYTVEARFKSDLNSESYLRFSGKPIHAEESGKIDLFNSSGFNDFQVLFTNYDRKTRRFKIFFTRVLNATQDLAGLIQLDDQNCDYNREQNMLTIYLPQASGKEQSELSVAAQLMDINGQKLGEPLMYTLDRNMSKPDVEMALKGNYIPTKGKVLVPIRTRNLQSVQVSVIEVPKENVKYYLSWHGVLQSNQDYLRQLGRPVYYEEVKLPGAALSAGNEWEDYALDLTHKFDRNPGAMYALELRFGPQNTLLDCGDIRKSVLSSSFRKEISGWENPKGYYFWDNSMWPDRWSYDFNWNETSDPCKLSYYLDRSRVSRNLMVSDLAIIAKQGKHEASVVVVDLHDLSSVSNAQVELFDYQGMSLGKGSTSSSGRAQFELSRRAQVALVRYNKQEVYLSLRQENANALSAFPISGSSAEEDRFFLYTERGVWRPGDSIHLCLMMDNRHEGIPLGLPVTLEFYDYKGSLLDRQRRKVQEDQQLYCFSLGTATQAKTGTYEARIQIGATTLRKSLPIETIRPNDVEVIYRFDHEEKKRIRHHQLKGKLTAQYLNGFPLVNATISAIASVYPIRQPFEKYKEYAFTSDETHPESALHVYKGTTDGKGELRFTNTPDFRKFNGKANVVLESSIDLPGGGLNQESQRFEIDPFQEYVGIKDLRGEGWQGSLKVSDKQNVPIVLLDRDGEKVTGTRKLRVQLMKYKNSWWIDRYALSRNASYQRSQYWTPVGEFTVDVINGDGVFQHQVEKYGKGSFMIVVQDGTKGHQAANYYTIYDDQAASAPLASPDALMVEIDQDECMAGQSVTLQYPEFESARVWISIEQGDRIIDQFWKELNPQNRSILITTDDDWSPNVYIHSTLLQAYGTVSNDRPLRMYAVQALLVKQDEPRVLPKISMPDELETGQSFEIKVNNKKNEAMEYTLAVVDEGLLNLTGFDTPDPYKHFQGKKSLRVNTWDIYKLLMRRFDGEFAGILSIGGDDAYRADVQTDLNRFKSVVKFFGPFKLKAGKTAKHRMAVDQFTGKLRVMLIACNAKGAGMTEKRVRVRSALMIQSQLPRSLNVRDNVSVPVTIFKDDPAIKSAALRAVTTNAIDVIDHDKTIPLANTDQKTEYIDLKVKNQPGETGLRFEVSGGGKRTEESHKIMINYPNAYESQIERQELSKGESLDWVLSAPGYPGVANYSLQVSGLKLPNFAEYADELMRYPYGCLEQTISCAMGQLFLDEVLDLSSDEVQAREDHVQAALTKLSSFQGGDGRFYLWAGSSYYHAWSGIYTGYFLLEAREKRINIPEGLLNKWQQTQTELANKWKIEGASTQSTQISEEQIQAFRLYILARSGEPALGAMNRLSQSASQNYLTEILLAGAYQLAAYSNMADKWLNKGFESYSAQDKHSAYSAYTYGGRDRNECLMIDVVSLFPDQRGRLEELYEGLVDRLNDRSWASTQTMAFAFLAANRYLKGIPTNINGAMNFRYLEGGNSRNYMVDYFKTQYFSFGSEADGKKLRLENLGDAPIYVQQLTRFVPDELKKNASASKLSIRVNMDGQVLSDDSRTIRAERGEEVLIYVRVSNESLRDFKDLALNLKMPAGLELLNPRVFKTVKMKPSSTSIHQDYRDDRVYTFLHLSKSQAKEYYFVAKAAFSGDFTLPSIRCEHMYNGDVYAETASGRLIVE